MDASWIAAGCSVIAAICAVVAMRRNSGQDSKTFVDERQLKRIKGAYLSEIARPIEQSAETGGIKGYKTTVNKLNNPKKYGVLSAMFKESDLEPLKKYLDFGERLGDPILSTSGTAPSLQIKEAINEGFQPKFAARLSQGLMARNLVSAQQELQKQFGKKAKPSTFGISQYLNKYPIRSAAQSAKIPFQQAARQYELSNREKR